MVVGSLVGCWEGVERDGRETWAIGFGFGVSCRWLKA